MQISSSIALFADADEALAIAPVRDHFPSIVLRAGAATIHFETPEAAMEWGQRVANLANDHRLSLLVEP